MLGVFVNLFLQVGVVAFHDCKKLTTQGLSAFCKEAFCKPSRLCELDLSGNEQLGDEVATALAPCNGASEKLSLRLRMFS